MRLSNKVDYHILHFSRIQHCQIRITFKETMGISGVCVCVILSVVVAVVTAQNPVRRPVVQARPVGDDEMNSIVAECNRRIQINDTIAHSARVPSDCSAFAFCEHPESGVEPALMLCPAGLFFNDDMAVLSCVAPSQANCPASVDPCSGQAEGFTRDQVRSLEFQAAFYLCNGGRTVGGGWCDYGEQFSNRDTACSAITDRNVPPLPVQETTPCPATAIDGSPNQFMLGGSVMNCAATTSFNAASCRCE